VFTKAHHLSLFWARWIFIFYFIYLMSHKSTPKQQARYRTCQAIIHNVQNNNKYVESNRNTIPCQVHNIITYKQDKPKVWREKHNKALANHWQKKQPDTDNKANFNKRDNTGSNNMQYNIEIKI
jgi:hypothetical protein